VRVAAGLPVATPFGAGAAAAEERAQARLPHRVPGDAAAGRILSTAGGGGGGWSVFGGRVHRTLLPLTLLSGEFRLLLLLRRRRRRCQDVLHGGGGRLCARIGGLQLQRAAKGIIVLGLFVQVGR